ncbi:MAG TPA: hypothetical protein VIM42_11760 [Clostridium sp.]
MDTKEAKEFSNDTKFGISQMVTLIDEQTQEIEYLKDKLEKCQIEDLTELYSPDCLEDVPFDGEYDFYEE